MAIFGVFVRYGAFDIMEDAIVVRDRFSILAAIAPVVWALWHRHWLAAFGYAVVSIVIGGGLALYPFGETADAAIILGVCFIQGLTAADVRRWSLTRVGYQLAAYGDAPNATAALHTLLVDDTEICEDLAATMTRPRRGWFFA